MTRINLVSVKDLADQHLFAEWREIKMVPAALRRSMRTRKTNDILSKVPTRYTLNAGHVTFFFDKMKFLVERYKMLTDELLNRKYNLSDNSGDFTQYTNDIPQVFAQKEWNPNNSEIAVNVERIVLRISEKPHWYKFLGSSLTPEFHSRYNTFLKGNV